MQRSSSKTMVAGISLAQIFSKSVISNRWVGISMGSARSS
jgi:hypothetical protein